MRLFDQQRVDGFDGDDALGCCCQVGVDGDQCVGLQPCDSEIFRIAGAAMSPRRRRISSWFSA
jgi:hypothetical protein